MEIEVVKKVADIRSRDYLSRNSFIDVSKRYFRNRNDIKVLKNPLKDRYHQDNPTELNPIRNADNRISHPWHRLLVTQKASYAMSTPPTFDTKDEHLNAEITKFLGASFAKIAMDLSIEASNAGIAWLHVWKDEDYQNFFRYGIVETEQLVPIFSKGFNKELVGMKRTYSDIDEEGNSVTIIEYWNDEKCAFYKKVKKDVGNGETEEFLEPYNLFSVIDTATNAKVDETNEYEHDWGEVPFIPFRNSADEMPDLLKYKDQIDVYDKVYSGFINDLDDVQEIIFILTNYGGQDRQEFLDDLNRFKTIKVDDYGQEGKGGVETLAVDIPTEARDKMLEITRESIFMLGQGVDPQKNIGQNNSGVALRQMYALLELKASEHEIEFRQGFSQLIRFIMIYSNKDPDIEVTQTWSRTMINNNSEQADVVAKLAAVSSKEAIAKSNPLVENWQDELDTLAKEDADDLRMENDYKPLDEDVVDDEDEETA
ncbi:phage portal protein [Aerococcus urinaeequi]|uniref:phage portal protein n=1 Tax=Aerococcus urinaeequi TaxID=51665 RepID=UPI003D6A2C25